MDEQQIFEVSQINTYIQEMLADDRLLNGLCIRGELSNYKKYPSGHHYFTLKDAESSLKCVMFRSSAMRLRFQPENGMMVLAAGRISVYPRDGVYQLYCVSMMPEGAGDLNVAFEQLKKKLSAEGLFDEEHKKPLPKYPHRIAIVTSSAGAAVHDMLRILRRRYPLAEVTILPVRVQGEEAAGEIAAAIDYVNYMEGADLIITGRGGGSMEDLWAFNEEIVARAIYRSKIPVISAVGHEPDVTIADYVADLRAATPSNGAELATPDQEELRPLLDSYQIRMTQSLSRLKKLKSQRLDMVQERLSGALAGQIPLSRGELLHRQQRLKQAMLTGLDRKRQKLMTLAAGLDAMSPLKVLSRGYSITTNDRGEAVCSAKELQPGDQITIRFHRGEAKALVEETKEERS